MYNSVCIFITMKFTSIAILLLLGTLLSAIMAVPIPEGGYVPSGQSEIYHDQTVRSLRHGPLQTYGAYRFGYKVDDPYTRNHQTRHEERDDTGVVRGSYSLVEPDGNIRTVYYIADKYGFRAYVQNSNKPDSAHGM